MKFTLFTTASLLATAAVAAGDAWEARHALTSSAYQETFDNLTTAGYRLDYVTGFADLKGDARYNAVFGKPASPSKVPWLANHGVTREKYTTVFNDLKDKGYRPLYVQGYNTLRQYLGEEYPRRGLGGANISGYAIGAEQRFASVFEKTTGGPAWKAYAGMSSDGYQARFDELKKAGLYPVQISPYNVGGKVWYAGVWEKVDAKAAKPYTRYGLTSSEYQALFDEWKGKGYKPTVVAGYIDGTTVKYAAIFNKN
ncbi:hypothetical protein FQN49_008340 [Arthroderma sp. PD_2]|nr:hypothetical protein FQN49_008340 [Arthroderma sp. PD_2]